LKRVIDIQVFGQTIRVRHEDEDYIRGLEQFLNEKVEMIQSNQKSSSTINLAARTVITLADDYLSLRTEKEQTAREVEEKAKRLVEFIDAKKVLVD
jgi:cell division protein ZapA (FtsZ GTPase activity inhibitor)